MQIAGTSGTDGLIQWQAPIKNELISLFAASKQEVNLNIKEKAVKEIVSLWGYTGNGRESEQEWFLSLCKIWYKLQTFPAFDKTVIRDVFTVREKIKTPSLFSDPGKAYFVEKKVAKIELIRSIHQQLTALMQHIGLQMRNQLKTVFHSLHCQSPIEANRLLRILYSRQLMVCHVYEKNLMQLFLESQPDQDKKIRCCSDNFLKEAFSLLGQGAFCIRSLDPLYFRILLDLDEEIIASKRDEIRYLATHLDLSKFFESQPPLRLVQILFTNHGGFLPQKEYLLKEAFPHQTGEEIIRYLIAAGALCPDGDLDIPKKNEDITM